MAIEPSHTPSALEWKVLDGLQGEGPPVKHFYVDRPSPWREGMVIQFSYPDGSGWIGNFATESCRRPAEILHWPSAMLIAVHIRGALFLIDERSPEQYEVHRGVNNFQLDADGNCLFVADHARVRAYGRHREVLWETGALGGYDAHIERVQSGFLLVDIQVEMGEPRRMLRVDPTDGSIIVPA